MINNLDVNASSSMVCSQVVDKDVAFTTNRRFQDFLVEHVKKEQIAPIMQACEKIFGQAVAIQEFSLVTGGRNTSKIIKFKVKDKEYICRATDSTRTGFYIDVPSEIRIVNIVNRADLTPKTHHNDASSGIIIMDFVPTVRLTAQMLEHERHGKEIYRDLALRLRTLHNSSSFTESPTNIFRDVEKTAKAGEASLMPPLAFDVLQNILKLESIVKKHQKNVPSHKDLTSNNVLYDGTRTYFIDWEMAADTDQFFDVAVVAIFHIFNESQEDDYLKSYCNTEPTPVQKAYFYVMKQLALAFWAFKHLRRVTVGQGKLDLSKEDVMAMQSLPPFKDFMLKTFNGCSKVFTYEDLKIASYMFLREAVRNMNSSDYEKAIQLLSK